MLQRMLLLGFLLTVLAGGTVLHSEEKLEKLKPLGKVHIPDELMVAFAKCEEFELFSLNSNRSDETTKDNEKFQGYPVYGKLTIKDAATRKKMVEAFQKTAFVEGIGIGLCFIPRHGVRFKKDGKTVDFLLCFQCGYNQIYIDEKKLDRYVINGSARDTFNKVLTDAKIKFDQPREPEKK